MSTVQPETEEVQQSLATAPSPGAEFASLSRSTRRGVFFHLPESMQETIVADMADDQLLAFVRGLDPDEVTDVLGYADEQTRERVLTRLDENRREKVQFLLTFSPESAAGMMHLNYVTVEIDAGFEEVARRVRRHEDRTGRFPVIFVTDDGTLVGELPAQALAMADRKSVV